jgi:NitT/TauT family transport system permease protein
MKTLRQAVSVVLTALAVCALLELSLKLAKVPSYLIPAPSGVLRAVFTEAHVIVPNLGFTMTEAVMGFVMGNLGAFVFGVVISQVPGARDRFYPFLIGFQAIPIVAIAPFIQIWFGSGYFGKALLASLIVYFPATVLAPVGAIVAELAGADRGVGYLILRASYEFQTTRLFAILTLTSLATILFYVVVNIIGEYYGHRFGFSYSNVSG